MKKPFVMLCMIGTILLLALIIPVAAETSTISSISPSQAYTGTTTGIITITGMNFNTTLVKVRLMKDGESNITGTVSFLSNTTIKCKFTLSSSETIGTWDVAVINKDGSESVDSGAFTIRKTMTLTSISPMSAQINNESAEVTVVGTGLSDVESMYLYNAYYENITGYIDTTESTEVVGTFDLTDADIDTYKICVEDSVGTIRCGLSFDVVTDEVGRIELESSPSGAKVYLDSTYMGTTPSTLEDVIPGSHKILISNAGYVDYIKWVTVKADSTVSVGVDLTKIQTATTTAAPTVTTTKTPLKANTVKVPTSWPTQATTQVSPLEVMVVLGAIALGFVVLCRK